MSWSLLWHLLWIAPLYSFFAGLIWGRMGGSYHEKTAPVWGALWPITAPMIVGACTMVWLRKR